jgi:hypothetical protein
MQMFVVLRSPESAGWTPDYEQIASFPTATLAEAFVNTTT